MRIQHDRSGKSLVALRQTRRGQAPGRLLRLLPALALLASSAVAEDLRVCFLDEDLPRAHRQQNRGFDLEVMRLVADGLGARMVPVWSPSAPPFSEIDDSDLPLESLERSLCDAVASVPGAAVLANSRSLALTRPYYGAGFELVTQLDPPPLLQDFGDQVIAVQVQTLAHYAVNALGLRWKARPTPKLVATLVASGEAQAALLWGPSLGQLDLLPAAGTAPIAALRFNEHIAVRKRGGLKVRIDDQLAILLGSGKLAELLEKHNVPPHPPFESTSGRAELKRLGLGN